MFQQGENVVSERARLCITSERMSSEFTAPELAVMETYIGSRVRTSHGFRCTADSGSNTIDTCKGYESKRKGIGGLEGDDDVRAHRCCSSAGSKTGLVSIGICRLVTLPQARIAQFAATSTSPNFLRLVYTLKILTIAASELKSLNSHPPASSLDRLYFRASPS